MWWTLFRAIAALAIVLLAVAGAELYVRYRDKVEDVHVLHQEVAVNAAYKVRRFVADIERTMRVATYHEDSILNGVSLSMQFQLVGLLKAEPSIATLAALDAEGRERAKVSRDRLYVPADLADRSSSVAFQRARQGRSYYGQPYFERGSEPHMTLAIPISWFDGVTSGVLVAEIALLDVSDFISQTSVGTGGYIYVVSEQGELIAHPDASLVLQQRSVADLEQTKLAGAPSAPPDRTYASLDGRQVFAAAAPIDDLGWTVVVEQDAAEVLTPLWTSLARTIAFALITLGIAAVLSTLVRRRVVRPLAVLQEGAGKVGEGDFAHRISIRSGDEFEQVAETFNEMSERLGQLYLALEQQADARKLELTAALLEAADLAKRSGDAERLAVTALGYQSSIAHRPEEGRVAVSLLEEALSANPAAGPALLVALDAALCRAYVLADKQPAAVQTYRRAVAGARALESETLLFQAHYAIATAAWPDLLPTRIEAGRAAMALTERLRRPAGEVATLAFSLFRGLIETGDFVEAQQLATGMAGMAAPDGDPALETINRRIGAMLALQRSAKAEVEQAIVAARGVQPTDLHASDLHLIQLFTLRRHQGRVGELREAIEERCRDPEDAAPYEPLLSLLYADEGSPEAARRMFDRSVSRDFVAPPARWMSTIANLAECAAVLTDRTQARLLRDLLLPFAGRNVVSDAVCLGPVERYLGLLDRCLGDSNSATRRFRAATSPEQAEFQPVWLAYSRLDLARELVNGRAERWPAATQLIQEARTASTALGLRPLSDACRSLLATRPAAEPDTGMALSPSEMRVLRLLATGATNRAIGERLKLSPHTVANHVRNILGKTSSANRTEAANFAREHDLVGDAEHDR